MVTETKARHEKLLHHLLKDGAIDVELMAVELGVSASTVRRGLRDLENRGLLRRTHGGAVPVETSFYEPFRYDASFVQQDAVRTDEKRRIGLAAAELVQEGEIVAISAGTTATQVARCLRHRSGITIVTNAVNVAMELSNSSGLRVISTGGVLSGSWFSLLGPVAIRTVEEFFFDWAFIGVDGIHASRGVTSHHQDEAALNRAMICNSRKAIAVADHSKLNQLARSHVSPLSDISQLITDTAALPGDLDAFVEHGLKVEAV